MKDTSSTTQISLADHLRSRHCDPDLYGVAIDEENYVATFWLYNFAKQRVGYQAYRPLVTKLQKNDLFGRYYTFFGREGEGKAKNRLGVFGIETLDHSETLYMTEGIFDAARLHTAGLAAIACLSNDPQHLRNSFSLVRKPLYAVCDGGRAGRKLAKYAHNWHQLPVDKDVSSLSESEFNDLLCIIT